MSTSNTDTQKMLTYAVAGLGAVVLAGLAYYLSADDAT